MKKTFLKTCCFALALSLLLSGAGLAAEPGAALGTTAAWVVKNVPAPQVGTTGGEWAVLGLARAGATVPAGYYENYYAAVEAYTAACGGVLSTRKFTEYSRVVLALTAIGRDPRHVAGYDVLRPLGDYDATIYQGISSIAFALIALDSGGYEVPANAEARTQATRAMYVDALLAREFAGGGFSLASTGAPDADVTAMVLTALSKYTDRAEVSAAVARGITRLSAMQQDDGSFLSGDLKTCESAAQVLVMLDTLDISPNDARFVKNGNTAVDALLGFAVGDGSFAHTPGGGTDGMATEQALCALAALAGQTALYDMGGVPKAVFSDIDGHANRTAIETLAAAGIIDGMGDGRFAPDATMTRAQFSAITVRALGLRPAAVDAFSDVGANAWYAPYVGTAYENGIIRGVGEGRFNPGGTITVREAEIMLARAARLCDLSWEEPAWFADPVLITRCEIAQGVYDMLREAGRLP